MIVEGEQSGRAWRRWTALLAGLLLAFAVLTIWIPARWPVHLFQAGVFLAGIAWAVRMGVRPYPIRGSFPLIPLGGATLWGPIQLAAGTTVYRFETWEETLFWVALFVLVLAGLQIFADAGVRRSVLLGMLYFGFGITVLAVVQLYTSEGKVFWIFESGYTEKVLGPFVYHNNFAAFVELLLPLALFEAMRARGDRALIHSVMAAVMFASVIAAASRAGAVMVTLEVLAVLALARVRGLINWRRLGEVLATFAVLAVLFSMVVGWRALLTRLQHPDPFVHRREILQSAVSMARERPWLGFGLGTFQTAYPEYAVFDIGRVVNHAHNDWAEWLAEGGAPFLGMLLIVAGWSVRPAVRSVWGIGLLSVFAHAAVDYPIQRLGLAAWIFVLLAALAAWNAEQGQKRLSGVPGAATL